MLSVLKNRTTDELVDHFFASKKRACVAATDDATSTYSDMAPLLASNENNSYMKGVVNEGDSVLAVAGAFDHLADMILLGAKNIMAVDVNELQFPVCWLKYIGFCFFSSCEDYTDFMLNPTSDKVLDVGIMRELLDFAPDSDMKEFWRKIYKLRIPRELRERYLYGEKKFLNLNETREMHYQYLLQNNFYKVKENISSARIYLQTSNIFAIDFCESFDVIHLSNIHNFMSDSFLNARLVELHSRIKTGARVIIYCIGFKKEWFSSIKDGELVLSSDDLDLRMMDEDVFFSIQKQIFSTIKLYQNMLKLFSKVEIIEVQTGKGLPMYSTGTDCVMILTK